MGIENQKSVYKRRRTIRRSDPAAGLSLLKRRRWYLDVTVTPANVQHSSKANLITGIAGETIDQGEVLYRDGSVSPAVLMLAVNSSAATAKCVGFAQSAAAEGQPCTYSDDDPDYNPGGTVVVGTRYFVSNTAGKVAPAADIGSAEYVSLVGIATVADKLPINIINSGIAVP